ncbi:LPXTG cell wall anchor domain-containing protein [Microbacterium sp. P07]|uniref:LPXTG cell wall anchor domain-containing protein n=1 Tax=Microbacterium sp. P07 TaxID=3366952 RepID=UPI003746C87E
MNSLLTKATTAVVAALFSLSPLAVSSVASAQTTPTPPTPAPADSPTATSSVTWSVRPGTACGPDGRSWVEWEGDPGSDRVEYLVVDNHGDEPVDFRLSAADGYFTETGRFNMLPSDRPSTDAGTWIALPETVSVAAKSSEIVPFQITVPADATPGDHPAGVAASIHTPGTDTVGVESRVGFRVMTRVTGELRTEASASVTGTFTGSVNPFEPGFIDIAYSITNTGNTRLRAAPLAVVSGPFGLAASERAGEEIADIAPGETRAGTLRVASVWPLAWYDVRVEATPVAVSDDVAVAEAVPVAASATLIALPWSQLAFLAIAALLVAWYLRQRRRDRRKTAELIAAARAEGRLTAPAEPPHAADAAAPDAALAAASSRRAARSAARVIAALLIGGALFAGGVTASTDASAASPTEDPGVEVNVEISPLPVPEPSTTPSATPTATPPTVPLPATGAGIDPALPVVAGALLAVGVLAVVHRRRNAPLAGD